MDDKKESAEGNTEESLPKVEGYLPPDIEAKFEFYNFGHALEILTQACTIEWNDLFDCFQEL